MQSSWNDADAASRQTDLDQRVYSSRLLGADPTLVLHGGGNTSVKVRETDLLGDEVELLYVKGSGWDLGTIQPAGFAPVRMDRLRRLAGLEALSDLQMARELRVATVDPAAPAPSVEAILHAILPARFVDHTHADAFVSVSNTPGGDRRVREIYGDCLVIVPYVMPGFALARLAAQLFAEQSGPATIGLALCNHGLFTFGDTAREAYERMVAMVTRAEDHLRRHGAWDLPAPAPAPAPASAPAAGPGPAEELRRDLADLRREVSRAAGAPMILASHQDPASLAFARRPDVAAVATRGPATPDHVIRTKRVPLVGRDVAAYAREYAAYFEACSARSGQKLTMLDPAPRVVLDPELGLVTVGRSAAEAAVAEDVYRHTMEMIGRATQLEAWQALPAADIFEVEYWDLEQVKLRRGGVPPVFQGEVALVTGAASGIGKACAEVFRERGAAVIALDLNPAVKDLFGGPRTGALGVACDITDERALRAALEVGVRAFGGLDMVVINAGLFPASQPVAGLAIEEWQRAMRVNLDANVTLLREAHPLLRAAPRGGRVVVNASKNVPAPGRGAASYSASKAALTQLARVAALEWGGDGIRVNVMHPDSVFDTALWTPELLAKRASSYGLSIEEYKTRNVLHTEITSRDVAAVAAELCGPAFAKTTGAQVSVDGGNDRVI